MVAISFRNLIIPDRFRGGDWSLIWKSTFHIKLYRLSAIGLFHLNRLSTFLYLFLAGVVDLVNLFGRALVQSFRNEFSSIVKQSVDCGAYRVGSKPKFILEKIFSAHRSKFIIHSHF